MVHLEKDMNEEATSDTSHTRCPVFSGGSESVASLIKNARRRKRLTQEELAKRSQMTAVQLCKIENGKSIPNRQTLKKLSGHIGVPYSELLIQAGYNNMKGENVLYKKDGSVLDVDSLVQSIYRTDSDFLSLFYDFESIGTEENIEVIRILLNAMRKEAKILCDPKAERDSAGEIFENYFVVLKHFIITSLMQIMQ